MPDDTPERRAERVEVDEPEADEGGGQEADGSEVDRGRVGERETPHAPGESGTIGDVGLEVAAALADEVVADVGGAIRRLPALRGLARALHRPPGHAQLRLAGGLGQLLDRLAVAVAAQEVHARRRRRPDRAAARAR